MKVELAGFNIPAKVLEKLPKSEREKATPEVISAAYARISRSTKNVAELVDEALKDVPKARASNEAIIYGMGHHSVADHVMFNFNIIGVSRLLVESIEKRRLAGYTEKSQRYVSLKGDYIRPEEFSSEDLKKFEELVTFQNDFYFRTNPKLLEHLKKKFPNKDERLLENMAKEDCRFSLSLATEAQLGCSYTGQTAELAIRELRNGKLQEEKKFAQLLYNAIVEKVPSIIQLTDPELFKKYNPGQELKDDNFKHTAKNLSELVENTLEEYDYEINLLSLPLHSDFLSEADTTLLSHNDPDRQIIAALAYKNSNRIVSDCYALADILIEKRETEKFVREALKHLSEFDKVPREFEAGYLIFEFPISASGFAQLKRHRMNTLLFQDYNPELGITIPSNIIEIGADKELKEVCDKSSDLYYEFLPKYGKAAEYCLTNAHRRRVIVATNMRQLYHISRTREDEHAQWEIRRIANSMAKLAKQVAPATAILLGGKHEFEKIRKKVYDER